MSTRTPHRRTLWEEGRTPGRLVAVGFALLVFLVGRGDVALFGRLTLLSDVTFVLLCSLAALLVRPRDFYTVGVCPPLVMLVVTALLTALVPAAFGDPSDGFVQSVVSGLAHHAQALVLGYASTLAILALRQVAIRHAGTIRLRGVPSGAAARRGG